MTNDEKWNHLEWLKLAFQAEVIGMVNYAFQTYMNLFFLFLISNFTLSKEDEAVLDKVAKRKVPASYFIKYYSKQDKNYSPWRKNLKISQYS